MQNKTLKLTSDKLQKNDDVKTEMIVSDAYRTPLLETHVSVCP